jgi:hypothetical protein
MLAQEKTIPEIAKAIDRVGKGADKFYAGALVDRGLRFFTNDRE